MASEGYGGPSVTHSARQFLYDLGGALSMRGATTLITSEVDSREPSFFPEATTADVIVGLHYSLQGVRQMRGLEAIKTRGTLPLPGLHSLALSDDGVVVCPRLEARVMAAVAAGAAAPAATDERAPVGLPLLDALLGGGLTRHTVTMAAGGMGTGKTLLGLHFALADVRPGEPVVFLGFRETGDQLVLKGTLIDGGAALRQALAPEGLLTLLHIAPVELDPDAVADRLLGALDQTGARRLVIDSVAELERGASGDIRRVDEYMAALVVALHIRGVTSLVIKETRRALDEATEFATDLAGMLSDNVLLLEQLAEGGRLRRLLSVVKMRFSAHDVTRHPFLIGPPDGIQVQPSDARTETTDRLPGA